MFKSLKPFYVSAYSKRTLKATIIGSEANRNEYVFQENKAQMDKLVEELRLKTHKVVKQGAGEAIKRHVAQGKLLPRDRINQIVDEGCDVLELSTLAAMGMYKDQVPSAGIVTAIGKVHGRDCMLVANDPTAKGGAYFPLTVKKHLRAQRIAEECRLPCIYLVESAGVHLPDQVDVCPDRNNFGTIFYNQSIMSSDGIPQISVILGTCTAAGAYITSMADECIIVKDQAVLFIAGPQLVRAATGEIISAKELGGAEMHCTKSGVTDHLAIDENHALQLTRDVVANLNWKHEQNTSDHSTSFEEPLFDVDDLHGIVGANLQRPFDIKEVIARIVDGSRFHEFKQLYGTSLVCGFATIYGHPVGIIGNNGVLESNSALKATHFMQLCEARKIPLLFLHNVSGFMVGKEAEAGGIAKDGAKMVTAVSCFKGPKITVMIGASFGAGNYAMCGTALLPTFVYAWPNSRIGVMGGPQAATVMSIIANDKAKREGITLSAESEKKLRSVTEAAFERDCNPYYLSARIIDDGVISPKDTRKVVGLSLSAALNAPFRKGTFGIFRM